MTVDGLAVPDARIGQRIVDRRSGVQVLEYIAVPLESGARDITAELVDPFGNVREKRSIIVHAPGQLAEIRISPVQPAMQAGGQGDALFSIALVDAAGRPVAARTPVTLRASSGTWQEDDLSEALPDLQTFIEGGSRTVRLKPPAESGRVTVSATSGTLAGKTFIDFISALRPFIAVGVVEGQISARDFDSGRIDSTEAHDGFSRTADAVAVDAGDVRASGRVALFLQGRVRGDYLLTVIADSEKREEDEWVTDIQPDRHYPIYGDGSLQHDGGSATGKLYLRLEKNGNFVQIADFAPTANARHDMLSAYRRTIYGFQERYEDGGFSFETFATRESSTRRVDEFRLRGTSGPFDLSRDDIVRNSETVEVITRASAPDGPVIETRTLARAVDYELDHDIGRLVLNQAVSGNDTQLRPVFLRVIYEVDEGEGSDLWVYGGSGRVAVTEHLSFGASLSREDGDDEGTDVTGFNTSYEIDENTWATAEFAISQSEDPLLGDTSGRAGRVELRRDGERLSLSARAIVADDGFENPGAGLIGGTATISAEASYRLDERWTFVETIDLDRDQTGNRDSAALESLLRTRLSEEVSVAGGHRFSWAQREGREDEEERESNVVQTHALVAHVNYRPAFVSGLELNSRAEQGLVEAERRRFRLGADYILPSEGRLHGSWEALTGFDVRGRPDNDGFRQRWTAGIVQPVFEVVDLYSEYRNDGSFGAENNAAMGFRTRYEFGDGLRLRLTGERVLDLGDEGDDDGHSASLRLLSPTSEDGEWNLRIEMSEDESGVDWLADGATGFRVSDALTALLRNRIIFGSGTQGIDDRLKLGLAYRNRERSDFAGLLGYELRTEPISDGARNSRHILRADGNLRVTPTVTLWNQIAGKIAQTDFSNQTFSATTLLTRGKVTVDVHRDWSLSAMGSLFGTADGGGVSYGAGAEVARRFGDGLLAVGYNHFQYSDGDLNGESIHNRGIYVRYSLAFDETTLAGLLEAFR